VAMDQPVCGNPIPADGDGMNPDPVRGRMYRPGRPETRKSVDRARGPAAADDDITSMPSARSHRPPGDARDRSR
jgi:hypothetical protein